MTKKRFKAVKNWWWDQWDVWSVDAQLKASFFGENCAQYARDHARRLNGENK